MDDPRADFLSKVDFSAVSIERFPKIIFFCGGECRPEYPPYLSARHYITTFLQVKHFRDFAVKNAEDIKEWNHYNVYPDLISFETDITHICKLVVLFVESPGSLVELGLFAATESIARKLLVFIPRLYSQDNSFISLGPIKYLQDRDSSLEHVYVYDFLNDLGCYEQTKIELDRQLIVDDILVQFGKRTRHAAADEERSKSRILLLICDLIYLFKALTITEVVNYIERLDIKNWTTKNVAQALFCLEKLDLIRIEKLSHATYYMPDEIDGLYLNYGKDVGRIDTARMSVKVTQYYAEEDKRRSRAIANAGEKS